MEIDLSKYHAEADNAQKEINALRAQVYELRTCIAEKTVVPTNDPEINKLITENIKLKHRLSILKRATMEQSQTVQSKRRN
ncbi:hypothetical protein NQ318_013410 [Aromia moschata]|uniref:Uncharacterized protein n=1 Tax=Aromia moschata TaxID=1265417 RepID=A0AAV8YQ24_9CUCU|nr:hypothetical protein NQ318_013410 [Aromia moschata]